MLPLPEISNTECVNFNDAIVWVALQIFPTNKFEPNDKGTLEWLQMIDFDKWAYENNKHDPLVYTPDICKEYKLPENIELKYIEAYKEEPSNPDLINYLLKDQSISKEEKEKLEAQLSEATEFYNKKNAFKNACNKLFKDAQYKLYSYISSGKIRIYGVKFTTKDNVCYTEQNVSQIPNDKLTFDSIDFENLELTLKTTKVQYGFLMVNLNELLKEFSPKEQTPVKMLQIGGQYLLTTDKRLLTSGRKAILTTQQIFLLGRHSLELQKNKPNKKPKYYIHDCIAWTERTFHKKISESTMRLYLKPCLKN